MKKPVSDKQFKNQVIFTIKGMRANISKIRKMLPGTSINPYLYASLHLEHIIHDIKSYEGRIVRKPK